MLNLVDKTYPSDWVFGGPANNHPGADPRFQSDSYRYMDDSLRLVFTSSAPCSDKEAIEGPEGFAWVTENFGPVTFLMVRRHGSDEVELLPVKYDAATNEYEEIISDDASAEGVA